MELGWVCTCTLGTTRCRESWVLLSMRLFQSSKSTVLRDKTRQQSRLPALPTGTGVFGCPQNSSHTSKDCSQTQPS